MSIIDDMRNDEVWDNYIQRKRKLAWDYTDIMRAQSFIGSRGYRPIVEAIAEGTYVFHDPYMFEIPKDNGKVRRVFSMKRADDISEVVVLQVMSKLLKRYQKGFCPNLSSMPENGGVVGVMEGLSSIKDWDTKYLFKFDVTDYGNSILIDRLIPMLEDLMDECDRPILKVLTDILRNPNVILRKDGKEIPMIFEQKGVMTGFPFVSFLSGLYLNEMDWHFYNLGKTYFRYNDDIAVVCDSLEDAEEQRDYILNYITSLGLTTNKDKMQIVEPGQVCGYLGITVNGNELSITKKTVMKYKNKMQVKAKQLRKKVNTGKMSETDAFDRMIRYVLGIQYGYDENSFSFMKTYFPRITSNKGLSDIDHYAQHYIRYVYTGRFSDMNYRKMPYEMIRAHGYVPLVSAYRIYRES